MGPWSSWGSESRDRAGSCRSQVRLPAARSAASRQTLPDRLGSGTRRRQRWLSRKRLVHAVSRAARSSAIALMCLPECPGSFRAGCRIRRAAMSRRRSWFDHHGQPADWRPDDAAIQHGMTTALYVSPARTGYGRDARPPAPPSPVEVSTLLVLAAVSGRSRPSKPPAEAERIDDGTVVGSIDDPVAIGPPAPTMRLKQLTAQSIRSTRLGPDQFRWQAALHLACRTEVRQDSAPRSRRGTGCTRRSAMSDGCAHTVLSALRLQSHSPYPPPATDDTVIDPIRGTLAGPDHSPADDFCTPKSCATPDELRSATLRSPANHGNLAGACPKQPTDGHETFLSPPAPRAH